MLRRHLDANMCDVKLQYILNSLWIVAGLCVSLPFVSLPFVSLPLALLSFSRPVGFLH